MIRTYPTSTTNKNVPPSVLLIGETQTANREITTTYYVTRAGDSYKVDDWSTSKPAPAYMFELARLTGDTEQMIFNRWLAWQRETK